MKLPKCIYGGETQEQLNQALRQLHDEVRKLTERRIDGFNLASTLLGDGLEYTTFSAISPGKIRNSLANTTGNTYITLKGDGASPENYYGIEVVVDTSNSTYGRFCIRDKDSDNQLISLVPDDPVSSDPGGDIQIPRGIFRLGTTANYNLRLYRNNTTMFEFKSDEITASEDLVPVTNNVYNLGKAGTGWLEVFTGTIDSGADSNLLLQRNNTTKLNIQNTQILSSDDINPDTSNTYDLGTASLAWRVAYARTLSSDTGVSLTIARGGTTKVVMESATIDVYDDLVPDTGSVYNLGSTTKAWSGAYLDAIDTAGNTTLILKQNTNNRIILQTAGQVTFDTGIDLEYTNTSSDINLDEGDCFIAVSASGAARTVNLPAISGALGRIYIIKKIDVTANTVTIDGNGAETIDGAATVTVALQYQTAIIVGGSSEWHKITGLV